jgi:hypothetical protein
VDIDKLGQPRSDQPTVGPAPSDPKPYVTIDDQIKNLEREADVRTGLSFGAIAYGLTGDLNFAEIVNGLASGLGGAASGRNGMSSTPIGNMESPPGQTAGGPPSPGASAAPPQR